MPTKNKEPKSLRIKDLSLDDRPREKLQQRGVKALTDAELIAIILRTGTQQMNVLELSQEILTREGGSLYQIYDMLRRRANPEINGFGPVKQTELLAAMELGVRTYIEKETRDAKRVSLLHSSMIYHYIKEELAFNTEEETWVILLNVRANPIGKFCIAQGGLSGATVDIRVILRKAIQYSASAIALVHNHPSGDAEPSAPDDDLTFKLQKACNAVDLRLIDHIIYVDNKEHYYSYFDAGRL